MKISSKPVRKKNVTRVRLSPELRASQILDAAARLILEEGFSELSMERLGREAGVSKALVYNYFENRTALLRALLEREISLLRARQQSEVKKASSFHELIYRTTRIYVEHIKDRGALLQRLWAEATVARSVAEDDRKSREQTLKYFARRVTEEYGIPPGIAESAVDMQMAMTEAAAQHLFRSNNDVELATTTCVTLLVGGLERLSLSYRNVAATSKRRSPAPKRAATPKR